MASFWFSSFTNYALLFLNLSLLFNNLAAKHSGFTARHSHHRHHHNHRHHITTHSNTSNPRLHQAFLALQAWKQVIYSDPKNLTTNWKGPSVCNYFGVYCAPALDDPTIQVVAGIDLNHGNIAGFLPNELGLLTDLALLHLNSNRFCGILPETLSNLTVLYEIDLSNNRFVGPFPMVVLSLPELNYLDIRYNEFEGPLPPQLFNKKLDAIFVNNNLLTNVIPSNFSGSSASVIVFAHNKFNGGLPPSIARLADTLEELVLINSSLTGCLPQEVGFLYKLKVLDISFNKVAGPIPYSLAGLAHLEQLDLAHNMMSGNVYEGVCTLPNLANFTFSYNFFCEEDGICRNLTSKGVVYEDRRNCLPEKPLQRSEKECNAVLDHPVDCLDHPWEGGGEHGSLGGVTRTFGPSIAASPVSMPIWSPSAAPSHS